MIVLKITGEADISMGNFEKGTISEAVARMDDIVSTYRNSGNATQIIQQSMSAADELKKFKELLDCGVISQEEFDAKKKQLLGL